MCKITYAHKSFINPETCSIGVLRNYKSRDGLVDFFYMDVDYFDRSIRLDHMEDSSKLVTEDEFIEFAYPFLFESFQKYKAQYEDRG